MNQDLQPREIVALLDEYIIGQDAAKKTIAIALRNRIRRLKLPENTREEITPKNILMIGQTGVGKTEIARRMAKIIGLPFVKVDASKYTEVGFVGRNVESMVQDLVMASAHLVKNRREEELKDEIDFYVFDKIARILVPEIPAGASDEKKAAYQNQIEKMREKIKSGAMDSAKIKISIERQMPVQSDMPLEMQKVQDLFLSAIKHKNSEKKEMLVSVAKVLLRSEGMNTLVDPEDIGQDALKLAESGGIIFIDEIDKIANSSTARQDPSKEGVQRDLLPIVEGSVVNTKFGQLKTDNILFIAAGAFHVSKPSDIIPELQGRFPIRVELGALDAKTLYQILKNTKNSLIFQYQMLFSVEKINLIFEDEAILEMAELALRANERLEDIGARRLHTIVEKILEDVSFESEKFAGKDVRITKEIVQEKLQDLIVNDDLTRYIL